MTNMFLDLKPSQGDTFQIPLDSLVSSAEGKKVGIVCGKDWWSYGHIKYLLKELADKDAIIILRTSQTSHREAAENFCDELGLLFLDDSKNFLPQGIHLTHLIEDCDLLALFGDDDLIKIMRLLANTFPTHYSLQKKPM